MGHRLGISHFWMNRVIYPLAFALVISLSHGIAHIWTGNKEFFEGAGVMEAGLSVFVSSYLMSGALIYMCENNTICSRKRCS